MKTKVIPIIIYRHSLQILFGDKSEIKETLIKKFKLKEEGLNDVLDIIDDSIGAYFFHDNEYFIWLPKIPKSIQDFGVLVHELQHYVFNFLRRRGFTHSQDSDEAYSYLLEYVYMETDRWILKLQKEEQNTNN